MGICCMAQETHTGALYQPRGWDGEGDGREVQKGGDIGMLLLLLSRFSRVQLCATPETAALQCSAVPGILQARALEWVAISFSNAWK